MADVLRIARRHWRDQKNAPIGLITVDQWRDENQAPVTMDVRRLNGVELAEINEQRRLNGERAGQATTIIKACYQPGIEKRVFADTDQQALMEDVDPSIIEWIHAQILTMINPVVAE